MRGFCRHFLLLFLLTLLFTHFPANRGIAGKEVPLPAINGLKIRIVPKNPEPLEGLGAKNISVYKSGNEIKVIWYSQIRIKKGDTPWPEYQILLQKGVLESGGLATATHFLHPHLWAPGYYRFDSSFLLWAPTEMLEAAKKKGSFVFESGLLSNAVELMPKGPELVRLSVKKFREVLLEPANSSTAGEESPETKKEQARNAELVEELRKVKIIESSGSQNLVIRGKQVRVPTVVAGNRYVQYTILKDRQNPLILGVTFRPAAAPPQLKAFFQFFEKYLEYQITQLQ